MGKMLGRIWRVTDVEEGEGVEMDKTKTFKFEEKLQ